MYVLCILLVHLYIWQCVPTTDQGTRPIMVLCGLAVEAQGPTKRTANGYSLTLPQHSFVWLMYA